MHNLSNILRTGEDPPALTVLVTVGCLGPHSSHSQSAKFLAPANEYFVRSAVLLIFSAIYCVERLPCLTIRQNEQA